MATKQTITKESAWKWVTESGIWDVAKWANWTEFSALSTSVTRSWRVVYWCAWHWRLLMELHAALQEAQHEHYIVPEDIVVDKDTGAVISSPKYGTEFARSPRMRGVLTRHGQVSKFWLEYKMKDFPE